MTRLHPAVYQLHSAIAHRRPLYAIKVLDDMAKQNINPPSSCLTPLLRQCKNDEDVDVSSSLFSKFKTHDTQQYNMLMLSCLNSKRLSDWSQPAFLLQKMKNEGIFPNSISYNLAIQSMARSGRAHSAVELLLEMRLAAVSPDKETLKAVLMACRHAKTWSIACNLLEDIHSTFLESDTVIFNLAISICTTCGRLEEGLRLLQKAISSNSVDAYMYRTVISLCQRLQDDRSIPVFADYYSKFKIEVDHPVLNLDPEKYSPLFVETFKKYFENRDVSDTFGDLVLKFQAKIIEYLNKNPHYTMNVIEDLKKLKLKPNFNYFALCCIELKEFRISLSVIQKALAEGRVIRDEVYHIFCHRLLLSGRSERKCLDELLDFLASQGKLQELGPSIVQYLVYQRNPKDSLILCIDLQNRGLEMSSLIESSKRNIEKNNGSPARRRFMILKAYSDRGVSKEVISLLREIKDEDKLSSQVCATGIHGLRFSRNRQDVDEVCKMMKDHNVTITPQILHELIRCYARSLSMRKVKKYLRHLHATDEVTALNLRALWNGFKEAKGMEHLAEIGALHTSKIYESEDVFQERLSSFLKGKERRAEM